MVVTSEASGASQASARAPSLGLPSRYSNLCEDAGWYQRCHLLALSALGVVLDKTLLVFEELIKEALLLVMVIAQVDRGVALDCLTRHELQQDSRTNRQDGEGNPSCASTLKSAGTCRKILSQNTNKVKVSADRKARVGQGRQVTIGHKIQTMRLKQGDLPRGTPLGALHRHCTSRTERHGMGWQKCQPHAYTQHVSTHEFPSPERCLTAWDHSSRQSQHRSRRVPSPWSPAAPPPP